MTREEIKKIVEGITDEQLKSILDINSADIGKAKKDYDDLKATNDALTKDKKELEDKIGTLTDKAKTADDVQKELDNLKADIKKKEDDAKAEAEDKALTEAITAVFGDKKFTSDYVRNGIIADMKVEIAKPENKGKGYVELFESLTKDKAGIFENPNKPANMPGMGNVDTNVSDDMARAIMGLSPKK